MFDRVDAAQWKDLALPISRRRGRGVFFERVCGWNEEVKAGLWAFHEAARERGVIIEGQIANPDDRQLQYLHEVLGDDFRADAAFIEAALQRWMPRLGADQRRELAAALCEQLEDQRRQGKTDSILRNLYCKVMCWLYYRFERLTPFLGQDNPPRILYVTAGITAHELLLLRLLNRMGADVLLIEPAGDANYLKRDPESRHSHLLVPAGQPFPGDFSLKQFRKEMAAAPASPKSTKAIDPMKYFQAPSRTACTNVWMEKAEYEQILTPIDRRGSDLDHYYNAFIRVRGVVDESTYMSGLHQFYRRLRNTGRSVVIADEGLTAPTQEEIARIRRRGYRNPQELTVDLADNLPGGASGELQRLMQRAFVETMTEAAREETALNRLLNAAVYLLCWIQRYQAALFQGFRAGDVPCFILMGGCRTAQEALFPKYLSRLPADVLILAPDLNRPCALRDGRLLELSGEQSLSVKRFPRDAADLQVSTLAASAEDELTATLYADSGLFRDRQFTRAEALTLRSTYDEVFILWEQELKYRMGFAIADQTVTMPVVYAKISGVEKGDVSDYWQQIKRLTEKDTYLVRRAPLIPPNSPNPFAPLALKVLRNGVLQRKRLREDRAYPFGMLRESLQTHMLDKLQLMLDRRMIRGTYESGVEYTVIATVLNMDKALVRMLQSFDFTRRNPKLVSIDVDDRGASLEDAILMTFLNLVGFDIALFVPTGYQTIERYLNDNPPVEHQAGVFKYDLAVPDLDSLPPPRGRSWLDNLFKRGH